MRVTELDLFRFIAALSVVFYHFVAWFVVDQPQNAITLELAFVVAQYGFLGVPLFFMISGFVILASAIQRSSLDFAAARIARLYPVYWFCVSITALVAYLAQVNPNLINWPNYLVNMTMLQSFVGIGNFDGVYWTLAKELQFYFCIFILIALGVLSRIKIWLSVWLVATATFLAFKQPFFMGWFISPEYSAFFIAGICCFMLKQQIDTQFYTWCLFASLILASYSTYYESAEFLAQTSSSKQAICVAIVWLFYAAFWMVATNQWHLKASRTLLSLGALTYPLYLIHNLVGKEMLNISLNWFGAELSVLLMCVVMIVFSYAIVVLVEKPLATPFKRMLLGFTQKLVVLTANKKS